MLTDKQVRLLKPEPGRDYVKSDGRVLLLLKWRTARRSFYYQWHVQGKEVAENSCRPGPHLAWLRREKVRQQTPSSEG